MTAASLSALLAALMAATDVSDEDKEAASKALAKDFAADTSDVPDADAVDAMPDDMAEAYKSDETPADVKAANLAAAKCMYKAGQVKSLLAASRVVKKVATVGEGAQNPPAGITKEDLAAAVGSALSTALDKERTKGYQTLGAQGTPANPQGGGARTGKDEPKKEFYKDRVQPLITAGVKGPEALSAARKKHPKEFAEWLNSKQSKN